MECFYCQPRNTSITTFYNLYPFHFDIFYSIAVTFFYNKTLKCVTNKNIILIIKQNKTQIDDLGMVT